MESGELETGLRLAAIMLACAMLSAFVTVSIGRALTAPAHGARSAPQAIAVVQAGLN